MTKIYKIIFMSGTFLSSMIAISSYTWLGMWLGLEINLLCIIPLMQNSKSILSSEAAVKYFIVQATASTLILMSITFLMLKTNINSNMLNDSNLMLIMNSALLTKMGSAPFHFWFPEVMEGLDWITCLLVLTWQKIAPMVLLMYNMKFTLFMTSVIIASMLISGLMGINQISMRKIMAYSSINHMGWMISSMMIMETIWTFYFIVYSVLTINLAMIFNKLKIFFINQLSQSMNNEAMTKMWFILNFLSLSGIPPLLGFMPKWLTIQALTNKELYFLSIVMIITTMITVFMYFRITLSTMLMNINEINWETSNIKFNSMLMSSLNFISLSSLIMITLMFNMN